MTGRFSATFLNRDFSRRVSIPWQTMGIEKYSHAARGGPKSASAMAYSDSLGLWEFLEMLRSPVTIYDNGRGKPVWWGALHDVEVSINKKRTASLRDFANYIQLRYTHNMQDLETSWAFDQDSIDTYGQKELALVDNDLEPEQAEQKRDVALKARKYPNVSKPVRVTGPGYSKLIFKGWYDLQEWKYFLTDVGYEAFEEETGSFSREVGEDDRPECAQSFQLASAVGWDAYVISMRVKKHKDTENENFVMDLCVDASGKPGSSLAQVSLDYTNFETSFQWVDFVLGTPVSLVPGVTYWIKSSKVGAIDLDECYLVAGDAGRGYPRGMFLIHNVGKGYWYEKPMDQNFRVWGRTETTDQIANMISEGGQFLLDTDLLVASGVERNQYRDGQNSTLYEINKLLDMGTSNDLRLHARVLQNLHLEVYEEPALFESNYSEDAHGIIRDHNGAIVPNADCPAGVWLNFSDLPSSVDTSRLINTDYTFVEQAEYIVANDYYNVIQGLNAPVYPGITRIING